MSFFDEKRGAVKAEFPHGKWWQTVHELHIEIPLPENIKSRQIQVVVQPKFIKIVFANELLFEGRLARTVKAEETVWTVEDRHLSIVLTNAQEFVNDNLWNSLMEDGSFAADPFTLLEMRKYLDLEKFQIEVTQNKYFYLLLEMRKYLDLEKFQIENPGFDFSGAKLSKAYDKIPS